MDEKEVYTERIKKDGTVTHCRTCAYFNRNKDVKYEQNWDHEAYFWIVDHIINDRGSLNVLVKQIKNHSFEEILEIVQKLNIRNKFLDVEVVCENCGETYMVAPYVFLAGGNHYCCYECYWADKPHKVGHAEENSQYNRIQTTCSNCNKDISVIPFDYNKVNSFGDSHNFCSQACYWEFRRKYYVQEKSGRCGVPVSQASKEKQAITLSKKYQTNEHLNSKPQIITNRLLENNDIAYTREYPAVYYMVDNYLDDYKLMIEVMGDFWHCNPNNYNMNTGIWKGQRIRIKNDKAKQTFIRNKYDINILYLWETDLNKNESLCELLIRRYISCQGVLPNYHSFNYHIDEFQKASLNQILVVPYQDRAIETYQEWVKT